MGIFGDCNIVTIGFNNFFCNSLNRGVLTIGSSLQNIFGNNNSVFFFLEKESPKNWVLFECMWLYGGEKILIRRN